jgi:hypothetical protein
VPVDAPTLAEFIVQELTARRKKDAWEAAAKSQAWERLNEVRVWVSKD